MSFVKVIENSGWTEVILSRPDLHNAFNEKMISEITEVFHNISASKSARLVVLKGEGKSFCAGADLNWMKSMVDYSLEENQKDSEALFDMFAAIKNCPLPVIGIVHGNVFGGGLGLVAACDIVLAEEETNFCFSEVKLGLIPAVISPFVLDKVNKSRVSEWMLSARIFSASEALLSGLVSFSGSKEMVKNRLVETLKGFLKNGPEALKECKKLIVKVDSLLSFDDWQKVRSFTSKKIAERRVSVEGQEGLRGFLNKEKPSWIKKLEEETIK